MKTSLDQYSTNKRIKPALAATGTIALVASAALILSGCSVATEKPAATQATDTTTLAGEKVPTNLAEFYSQTIDWEPCDETLECGTLTVPLDWNKPEGKTIEVAVNRVVSTADTKLGSIITNPGGPGASGLDFIKAVSGTPNIKTLASEYDVVGFDPRGVGKTSPLNCFDSAEQSDKHMEGDINQSTDAGFNNLLSQTRDFGQSCEKLSGDIVKHADTISVAKDMDVLRVALGDKKLNYYGLSYGTYLGATYADLFPKKVGHMVLDATLDPTKTSAERDIENARGYERTLRAYLEACHTNADCPFPADTDQATKQVKDLLKSLSEKPLVGADGRELTSYLLTSLIVSQLAHPAAWPELTKILTSAQAGDPAPAFASLDLMFPRTKQSEPLQSNALPAAINILCSTFESGVNDFSDARTNAKRVKEASPTFGDSLGYLGVWRSGAANCIGMPATAPKGSAHAIKAPGADPIVVIGSTLDSSTPYEWAESLASQLTSGVLLTREGAGHGSYFTGNTCIDKNVENYFLEDTVPKDKTRC